MIETKPRIELVPDPGEPAPKPKIKWLRLVMVLGGLGLLAAVSTAFGMMMAIASDLPRVEVIEVSDTPSRILDRNGNELGELTGNENRILVSSEEIAPVMKHAIVSIEDRRFYTHSGVDIRGVGRALWQDVVSRRIVQGGSTIAQQLVKNRLAPQSDRTILQKAREAALAFHMTREWPKDKILTNYLNTIYFGNGAYGIEAAAKTYFGHTHTACGGKGKRCAEELEPHEAALIAGVVASPSAYDPVANPGAAKARRDLVLQRMLEQGYITQFQFEESIREPLPTEADVQPPQESSRFPYFTTWVRQQVVDKVGPSKAFEGGLEVRTTIDPKLQQAAQDAIARWPLGFDGVAPAASLVAIDNRTSEVLALVGGGATPEAFNQRPFNLATQGQRQPGSAFKPFVLAEALSRGVSPQSVWTSKKKTFCVTRRKGKCVEGFEVNNYEDAYAGVTTLARATTFSDNSVYAELGIKIGTKKIARRARRMGIRTSVSSNPAMTLGGLRRGVTVLDMAHAYQTFATGGKLVYGSLSPGVERYEESERLPVPGPVGIREIREGRQNGRRGEVVELEDGTKAVNKKLTERVLSEKVAAQVGSILSGVVKFGTARRAALGSSVFVAGKTGTTENYGDAWFVGWSGRYTVAVWVGYPNELRSMDYPNLTFNGEPVAGGTYPAAIWHDFLKRALEIYPGPKKKDEEDEDAASAVPVSPSATVAPEATAQRGSSRRRETEREEPAADPAPDQVAPPAPEAEQPPAPPPSPPPPAGGAAPEGGGAAPPS